jgi:small subunit ribosomal protein S19
MADEFRFRGRTLKELTDMGEKEFSMLLGSRRRRTLARGLTAQEKALVEKLAKKDNVKTHARGMVILPKMVGKTIMIYNGKEFAKVRIAEEMIGHVLGEFAPTRRKVAHNAPGIGATKSSASVSVR